MKILDFLFNICFAPVRKVKTNGRLAALIWLAPSLTFIVMGIINALLYGFLGKITSVISPLVLAVFILILFAMVYLALDRIYLKGNRATGNLSFTIAILLLPILVIGSMVFFAFTVDKFG